MDLDGRWGGGKFGDGRRHGGALCDGMRAPSWDGPLLQFLRHHLIPLLLFVALSLVICGPVLSSPLILAIGHEGNDVWNHVWGYWWVSEELSSFRLPIRTDHLGWPYGGSLWFIDTLNAVLMLPVEVLAGPVAAYNAAFFFNFMLCGVGAYALTLHVTDSRVGATVAGVAYMVTPHLLGQAYNGISETCSAGWLPLALVAMRVTFAHPTPRNAVLAGALAGLNALASWYYGLFAGFFLIAMIGGAIYDRYRPPRLRVTRRKQRRVEVMPSVPWGLAMRTLAIGVGATALVVAGPFAAFLSTMGAEDAMVTRDPDFVWSTLIMHNMTDLVALVMPGKFYSPDLKAVFNEDLIVVVSLGHMLLWPALLGGLVVTDRNGRRWIGIALAFLALSLGPFLYVNGDYLLVLGGWMPLPFLAFFKAFPMFSRISHAYRFVQGATVALVVLLGWLVAEVERRRGWTVALLLGLILGTGRVLESFYATAAVFPLPTSRVEPHPVFSALDQGAVLDLPVGVPVLARSHYLAGQLAHGLPVVYALNDPTPPILYHNRYTAYLLEIERTTLSLLPAEMPWLDIELGRQHIVQEGLRWVVVHKSWYPEDRLRMTLQFLDLTATPMFDDTRGDGYILQITRCLFW